MTDDEFLNDRDIPNSGPRTDAVKFEIRWRNGEYRVTRPGIKTMEVVPAEEMAKLERELAAARAEVEQLKLVVKSGPWLVAELDKTRAELERAMKVVEAAVAYGKADGSEAMFQLMTLEHAVQEWEAGR